MTRLTLFSKHLSISISAFIILICFSCNRKQISSSTTTGSTNEKITATIWPSTETDLSFPEDKLNLPKTGICMSGGGTRAMVCAVGQLKGLMDIGVLDHVGYISCVSGGSWASVPFTYYTEGATGDDQLLGTIIAPKDLRLCKMKRLTPGFLAGAAKAPLLATMVKNLGKYPTPDIWIQGISQSYMKPFGLYDQNAPKYFSYDANTVRDICSRNPNLSPSDFITVRNQPGDAHRPYLVVNSSITGPYSLAPYKNPEQLAVFNYTPLGIGSAVPLTALYTPEEGGEGYYQSIGGGFIEPFAFGAKAPTEAPTPCSTQGQRSLCVNLIKPPKAYPIANASGTSSAAYVAELTSHGIDGLSAKDLSPQQTYWPISTSNVPTGENFIFGDGGNLENLGVISLLQRKVYNLAVFINTDEGVNIDYNHVTQPTPTPKDISSDVLTLFGIPFDGSEDMNKNQVFATEDIYQLTDQFIAAKIAGKSIIATTTLTTVANSWWGIPAGQTVKLVWVYNDKVDDYINQLKWNIRDQIKDFDGLPDFYRFPLYATVDEDLGRLVKLSPRQINLLYQFSAWNVYTNPDKFNILKGN